MLEHDSLPTCIRELQPLGGGHKCKENGDPNIMAASIPWERIRGIAEAVEFSTAGRAEPSEKFERMTENMRSKR